MLGCILGTYCVCMRIVHPNLKFGTLQPILANAAAAFAAAKDCLLLYGKKKHKDGIMSLGSFINQATASLPRSLIAFWQRGKMNGRTSKSSSASNKSGVQTWGSAQTCFYACTDPAKKHPGSFHRGLVPPGRGLPLQAMRAHDLGTFYRLWKDGALCRALAGERHHSPLQYPAKQQKLPK